MVIINTNIDKIDIDPAFNVADSFICVGAALFVIDGFRQGKRNQAT